MAACARWRGFSNMPLIVGKMATILVVDDEADVRHMMQTIIERRGHRVVTAADTAAAWELLKEKPDGMFVDIHMPGETGVEFVMRLRRDERFCELPIVFITASRERAFVFQKSDQRALEVIEKPFRVEQIGKAIENMLGD